MKDADRISVLEEEVRQLRAMLSVEPKRQIVARLQDGLGLTPYQAILLGVLYDAGSSWVSERRLDLALPARGPDQSRQPNTIRVQIHYMRQKLGEGAILGVRDHGYALGAPGVEAVRRVLSDERLVAGEV